MNRLYGGRVEAMSYTDTQNQLEMRNMNTQHVTSMTESKSPPDFDDRRMTRSVKEGATKRELQVPKPQDPNGECFVRSYSY